MSRWDSSSRPSVLVLTLMVLTVTPIRSAIWFRKSSATVVKELNVASSITPSSRPSNSTGSTTMWAGEASPRPEAILRYPGGASLRMIARFSTAAWPISDSPGRKVVGIALRW